MLPSVMMWTQYVTPGVCAWMYTEYKDTSRSSTLLEILRQYTLQGQRLAGGSCWS